MTYTNNTDKLCESTFLNCLFINFFSIVLNNSGPCSELQNFLRIYSMKIKYIFTFIFRKQPIFIPR